MGKKRKQLPKGAAILIIASAVLAVIISVILILNAFVPVKYLSAYTVKRNQRAEDEMRVTYINVGFGDSALIELPDGKCALIDGGDGARDHVSAILRTLNARKVKNIDYLICTSIKGEHCGGLAEIIKYKSVTKAYIPYCRNTRITEGYYSLLSALDKRGAAITYSAVGEGFCGDGYDYFLTFLSPSPSSNPQGEYAALNTQPTAKNIDLASAICWLEYGGVSFAFCSDARAESFEKIILQNSLAKQSGTKFMLYEGHEVILENCNVVTVAGHGGKDSEYAPWYDLLKPENAIVSVGKNYSGCPSAVALSDVYNYTTPYYTDGDGTVSVSVKDGEYKVWKVKQ